MGRGLGETIEGGKFVQRFKARVSVSTPLSLTVAPFHTDGKVPLADDTKTSMLIRLESDGAITRAAIFQRQVTFQMG